MLEVRLYNGIGNMEVNLRVKLETRVELEVYSYYWISSVKLVFKEGGVQATIHIIRTLLRMQTCYFGLQRDSTPQAHICMSQVPRSFLCCSKYKLLLAKAVSGIINTAPMLH